MKIKDGCGNYANVIEKAIGSQLGTFVVSNYDDKKLLMSLRRQTGCKHYEANVVIKKSEPRFSRLNSPVCILSHHILTRSPFVFLPHFRKHPVPCILPLFSSSFKDDRLLTIERAITVSDDNAYNTFIDQVSIEKLLLVENLEVGPVHKTEFYYYFVVPASNS